MYVVGLYSCPTGLALLFARRTGNSSARRQSRATSITRGERSVATLVRRVATSPWSAWTSVRREVTSKRSVLTFVSRCWSLVRRFVAHAGSAAARTAGMYAWLSRVSEVMVADSSCTADVILELRLDLRL